MWRATIHLSLIWIKLHIIGESVSGSSGDTPLSPSTHGGGGGGRGDTSELRLGGKGRTKAGWRWRKEARNPSQAAISLSAAFTCRRERLVEDVFITNVVESRDRSLEYTGSKLLFYKQCVKLMWALTLICCCFLASAAAARLCCSSAGKLSSSLTESRTQAQPSLVSRGLPTSDAFSLCKLVFL